MSECLVSAADYARYWTAEERTKKPARELRPAKKYSGPERRTNIRDRRWNARGGRRRFDQR